MHFDLSPLATRVLACLIEKEKTTPESYPLTLNSLVAAVNQSSNRDPVMSAEPDEVERAVEELREQKVAALIRLSGSRVSKYRHHLPDHYDFSTGETALLCVLMLRGPQTVGELKNRCERLHLFHDLPEVEQQLQTLAEGEEPLVRQLPPRPGQKGQRWVQLLTGEPTAEPEQAPTAYLPPATREPTPLQQLQTRVDTLETELAELKEAFEKLRTELEG